MTSAVERKTKGPRIIGWRERVSLPDFGVLGIKAKIDTGATVSALHAFRPRYSQRSDGEWISFEIHPRRRSNKDAVRVSAKVFTYRYVRSSNGSRELRPVIKTSISLGGEIWQTEITLANRYLMAYRMILGRSALRGRFIVDSGRSYQFGE
ncbi:MAG: RimK/LysX family protein [Chloroflexi bacterium]|nr:RimK/LysX family protein [Chloroflexota bacterium]